MNPGIIIILFFLTITAWAMLFPDGNNNRRNIWDMLSTCFRFGKKNRYRLLQEQYELVLAREQDLKLMLQDREELLAKALQVKDEFLKHLEHEGNTPITGIASMSEALLANYDKLDGEQIKEMLKIIAASSDRLRIFVFNFINLMQIRKLSNIAYQATREKVNLSKLIYDRIEHCQKLYLDNKNIEFITRFESSNINVNGNLHHLSSTIDSLIINAIKYTAKDKARIIITLAKHQSKVEFTITDQGVGIPKEELVTIFEPFTVGSKTRTISGYIPNGQRGIGLALCKLVIEAHGGKIWAESDNSEGAKFSFILPVN